jgi:hypothetical protein
MILIVYMFQARPEGYHTHSDCLLPPFDSTLGQLDTRDVNNPYRLHGPIFVPNQTLKYTGIPE